MVLTHLSFFHEKKHDKENNETYQNMQAVQTGHGIVEPVKEDLPFAAFQEPWRIGIDSMMNLPAPLEIFIPQKEKSKENGGDQKELRKSSIPFLEGRNRKSHGQAAGEEENSIECPERPIQLSSSQMKIRRILKTVDRVENEEPPEEKHFREEEEPHPYF